MIYSSVLPTASQRRTSQTVIRSPRMHGWPERFPSSMVMRVSSMALTIRSYRGIVPQLIPCRGSVDVVDDQHVQGHALGLLQFQSELLFERGSLRALHEFRSASTTKRFG